MFVQMIHGVISDEAGLRQSIDRLVNDLEAEAVGHLGTTAGTCDDGTFVAVFRFDSADAATKNSARPQQQLWWIEVESFFDGDLTLTEYTDPAPVTGSPADEAKPANGDSAAEASVSGARAKEHPLVEKIKDVWHDISYGQKRLIERNRPGATRVAPEAQT